ncbi:hypothetical protein PENTCL1PPCAC_24490, partial [Pristionchus entomophagus]
PYTLSIDRGSDKRDLIFHIKQQQRMRKGVRYAMRNFLNKEESVHERYQMQCILPDISWNQLHDIESGRRWRIDICSVKVAPIRVCADVCGATITTYKFLWEKDSMTIS